MVGTKFPISLKDWSLIHKDMEVFLKNFSMFISGSTKKHVKEDC